MQNLEGQPSLASLNTNDGIESIGDQTFKLLRLCIHQRDFELGNSIEENILTAMEQSKKVILVVSHSFVQSNWCKFEMEIARMQSLERGRNLVVPIMLQPVRMEEMTASLKWMVRRHTYIEWKEDSSGQEEFWKRLRRVLRDPGLESWICECGRTVFDRDNRMSEDGD